MMFSRGDKALISGQIVTVVTVDYYDRKYPYRVEFSDGARYWVTGEELQPIKKNRARVVYSADE